MKSKCCNKPLRLSRENPEPGETMYYICDGCNQPADPKCDHGDHIMCNECTDTFNDEYEVTDEQLHADDYVDKNYPDEREVSKLKEASMQNEPQLSAEMERKWAEFLSPWDIETTGDIEFRKAASTFLATALEEQRAEFERLVELLPSPEFVIVSLSEEGKTKAGQLYVRKDDVLTKLNQLKGSDVTR